MHKFSEWFFAGLGFSAGFFLFLFFFRLFEIVYQSV